MEREGCGWCEKRVAPLVNIHDENSTPMLREIPPRVVTTTLRSRSMRSASVVIVPRRWLGSPRGAQEATAGPGAHGRGCLQPCRRLLMAGLYAVRMRYMYGTSTHSHITYEPPNNKSSTPRNAYFSLVTTEIRRGGVPDAIPAFTNECMHRYMLQRKTQYS